MDNMDSSSVPGSGPRRMERVEICIISLSLLPPSRPWMTIGFLRLAKVEKDGVLLPCNGRRCPYGNPLSPHFEGDLVQQLRKSETDSCVCSGDGYGTLC